MKLLPEERAVARAWEHFADGGDHAPGVRPEIAASWLRSRDEFRVDPARDRALPADPSSAFAPEESVVATELGAAAARLLPDVTAVGGVVVVADGLGRMLSAWGDTRSASRGGDQNLCPLYSWAEPSVGTTGIGTALVSSGPVLVHRFEHWCSPFQDWTCAAVAVRGPHGQPAGAIGISAWRRPLPRQAPGLLQTVARDVERRLGQRLAAAWKGVQRAPQAPARLVGLRGTRNVIVPVSSIRLVVVEDGLVWLETEDGRVRAVARGLDQIEQWLGPAGFVRVNRTALVDVDRVREIVPAFKGAVWIVVDGIDAPVAVSRRRVAALRAALGI